MSLSGILGGFESFKKQFFHIFGAKEKIGFFWENIGFFFIFLLSIFPSQNRFQPNRKPAKKNDFLVLA